MSDSVFIVLKHFVSSAKLYIYVCVCVLDELIAEWRSLMNTMKSKGSSMLPCGTPDNIQVSI